jgi:ligand-binding sensor domain-containing protein
MRQSILATRSLIARCVALCIVLCIVTAALTAAIDVAAAAHRRCLLGRFGVNKSRCVAPFRRRCRPSCASPIAGRRPPANTTVDAKSAEPSRYLALEYNDILQPMVNAIAILPDGVLAFGTDHGLVFWNQGELKPLTGPFYDPLVPRSNRTGMTPGNSALPSNRIQDLLVAADGRLWIGTAFGLAVYANGEIENVTARLPSTGDKSEQVFQWNGNQGHMVRGPLLHQSVTSLFSCPDGRILIGTHNAGVIFYDPATDDFQLAYRQPDGNQWVSRVAEAPDGTLWIAVRGLGVLNCRHGRVALEPFPPQAGDPADVRSLCLGVDGTLWIATIKGLLARQPDGSAEWFREADGLPGDFVSRVWTQPNGDVWVYGDEGMAVRRNGKWQYPEFKSGEPVMMPPWGSWPSDDNWLITYTGVYRNPAVTWWPTSARERNLEKYKAATENSYPQIVPNGVIAVDADGQAWLGLRKSLLRYDGRTWTDLTPELGKKRDISFVRADSRGRIWVGTSGNGLVRFDGARSESFFNNPDHSMSVIYSFAEAADGTVYIGSQFGLYAFKDGEPKNITNRYQVITIVIDGLNRAWFTDPNTGLLLYDGGEVRELARDPQLAGWHVGDLALVRPNAVRITAYSLQPTGDRQAVFECDGKTVMRVTGEPAAKGSPQN